MLSDIAPAFRSGETKQDNGLITCGDGPTKLSVVRDGILNKISTTEPGVDRRAGSADDYPTSATTWVNEYQPQTCCVCRGDTGVVTVTSEPSVAATTAF